MPKTRGKILQRLWQWFNNFHSFYGHRCPSTLASLPPYSSKQVLHHKTTHTCHYAEWFVAIFSYFFALALAYFVHLMTTKIVTKILPEYLSSFLH